MSRLTRRLLLAMLLGMAIYVGFAVFRDVHRMADAFRRFSWWALCAACALAFGNYLLRFLKWEYYLKVMGIRGIPMGESLLTFLAGFVLTVTPGKVGEVFKSLILLDLRQVPVRRSAPIVVAERLTDLIAVILMIVVGSVSFPGGLPWAATGTALVLFLLLFVSWSALSDGCLRLAERLPGPLGAAAGRVVPKVREALAQLRDFTSPGRLVWPTALSCAAWLLEGLGLWVIVSGFGEHPSVPLAVFSYATATLAGAVVAIAPGGLGVTEALLEQQLHHLGGVPLNIATASMILIRCATLWFAVLVGFFALGALRVKHPQLLSDTKEV